jgi:uncharacterized protein (TIGR01244 family)
MVPALLLMLTCACASAPPEPVYPVLDAKLAGFPRISAVGDVLLGGQPTPEGLVNARDDGVTLVINSRPDSEMTFDERSVVEGLGMRYLSLPFVPATLNDELVTTFLAEMRQRQGRVLVHCSSGNRVAALWAMYEISELDVDPETAVDRARQAGLRSPELVAWIGEYARRTGAW